MDKEAHMKLFQVDAFTNRVFGGNPAAVMPLEHWPDDSLLQQLAAENNLAETAFLVPDTEADYQLRWFTPTTEVDLCGHATLASAWVLFHRLGFEKPTVRFQTASGILTVQRDGERLSMNFPAWPPRPVEPDPALLQALGLDGAEQALMSRDALLILKDEAAVRAVTPDFRALAALDLFAAMVSAPGDNCDVVYRFFAPAQGIDEDPVTGSACSTLVPWWSERLDRAELHIRQLSPRGGELFCTARGDRVTIAGQAVCYLEGEVTL